MAKLLMVVVARALVVRKTWHANWSGRVAQKERDKGTRFLALQLIGQVPDRLDFT